jgi:hypothetical protein
VRAGGDAEAEEALRAQVEEGWALLRDALRLQLGPELSAGSCAPALTLDLYANLLGAFELNNVSVVMCSPLVAYARAAAALERGELRKAAERALVPQALKAQAAVEAEAEELEEENADSGSDVSYDEGRAMAFLRGEGEAAEEAADCEGEELSNRCALSPSGSH